MTVDERLLVEFGISRSDSNASTVPYVFTHTTLPNHVNTDIGDKKQEEHPGDEVDPDERVAPEHQAKNEAMVTDEPRQKRTPQHMKKKKKTSTWNSSVTPSI